MPNGNKIRAAMAQKNMNQRELARKSGINVEHLCKIIKNNTNVKENTLMRLCKALDCKAEDIVNDYQ